MHLPAISTIASWRDFSKDRPLRILVSACLAGEKCGIDGTSNGEYAWMVRLINLPNVKALRFCPEHFSFGTPRDLPDIHGGNGFDVLDGKAKVLSDKGDDLTAGMIAGAYEMLKLAQKNQIELAVLMDMSAACGSQVISNGCRLDPERKYQKGPGVAAALLMRNGFPVVSQRDYRTLESIYKKLDTGHVINSDAIDHHETAWYKNYFVGSGMVNS